MNGAEPKTKSKRIRHCYPRQEVYHRFIHDNEYYYSNQAYAISSKGNYLSLGDIGRNKSIADIEQYWYSNSRVFAVIDRENKKILVSHKYKTVASELLRAIPDNYTVFHCGENIPCYDILNDDNIDLLCKLHLKYSIECYVSKRLYSFYAVCVNGKNILHTNIDEIEYCFKSTYIYYSYYAIKNFVKKYKVKKRNWYDKTLNSNFKLNIDYPDNWSSINIELPSVKEIVNNTVFNKARKDEFRKKYFYTKYCYGRGIPYSDVNKYFNVSISHAKAIQYCKHKNIYLNPDWLVDVYTWNELISKTKNIEDKICANRVQENIAKSDDNYKTALAKLNKLEIEYTINDWREGKIRPNSKVTYRKFTPSNRKGKTGTWSTAVIQNCTKTFSNIQLKLINNQILTSKYATVSIEDAIDMYKLFNILIHKHPNCNNFTISDFGIIHVGIYNLRFITYKDKVTDYGQNLGYKEWLIQIGCHAIWLDDVKNFIKYYHLEDKFGIN